MKKLTLCIALMSLLALGGQAIGEICTIDAVPAATLLLPYFEVDLDDPNGVTTLFSVNNASATAVLAHVVVWTDLSVISLDFDIYLTGYDVQTLNLRDMFVNGVLPRTASLGQDPSDTISPQGAFSDDINYASCTGQLPYNNPVLNAAFLAHLQSLHTGGPSSFYGGLCGGIEHGDNIARGYITVDTVSQCNLSAPSTPGYFIDGGLGIATNENVLWGDYFYVDPANNFAEGDNLVHIEADALAFIPGDYTFYGRYVAFNSADNREPLATNFAARYINDDGAFDGGTDVICWRDTGFDQTPFSCALSFPSPFPLGQQQVVIFDEQENPDTPQGCPVSPCPENPENNICPWESTRTEIGDDFPVPFEFGWLYLNLNTSTGSLIDPVKQAWVSTVHDAQGRFAVGYSAIQLDSACDPFLGFIGGD